MDHNSVLKDTSLGSANISLAPLEVTAHHHNNKAATRHPVASILHPCAATCQAVDSHEVEAPLSRQGHVYARIDWQPRGA